KMIWMPEWQMQPQQRAKEGKEGKIYEVLNFFLLPYDLVISAKITCVQIY
ncbi:MAG: hypothetical protein ACI8ZN_001937, partial [Bacteroidia bacterium]